MATTHSTPPSSLPSSASLLSIGDASKKLGVHVNTLREWTNKGEFPAVVLPSGHRRYRLEDVREYLGLDPCEADGGPGTPIALVARVSTNKQARARVEGGESDLDLKFCRLTSTASEP